MSLLVLSSQPPAFAPALVRAVDGVAVGVIVAVRLGPTWACRYQNARALAFLGRTLLRLPADLDCDPQTLADVTAWLDDGERRSAAFDAVSVPASDGPRLLRIVGSRVEGRDDRVVLFLYDASAEDRARRAMVESENRFRRVLDAVPDAICIGTRARFLYANPAFVRLLGYSTMEEVTRTPLREHLHPDDLDSARRLVLSLLETGRPPPGIPMRARRRDGSYLLADLRALAVEWGGETVLLGIARDLTERRRAQAQLIQADRLAAMGTLTAGVAHEINNPLAYLMLNLQYVLRELPRFDGNPAHLAVLLERLAEAEHGARRVSAITGDLRAFSRPDEMERGPVSVRRAMEAAIKVAGPQIRDRARLVESYEPSPLVDGSVVRLEQVFVNLLVNAAQALSPESAVSEVRVSVRSEAARVVVEVADTGRGIPADLVGRVFDPFFTTKPRGIGTGLGLPISRGIVVQLGGDLSVESEVGKGSVFRVSLPALPAGDLESAKETVDKTTKVGPRARLLVIDDEPLVASMLRRALSESHDVTVATDARTALAYILAGQQFDVIFCDLLMPLMSGMDLYAELASRSDGVAQRIIFMTGGAFTARAAEFLAEVKNPKLVKPFDLGALERVLAETLARLR